MTKLRALRGLALAGAALLVAAAAHAGGGKHPVLVELYTSQGCSSCIPADALLSRLTDRKDVLALSFPITYWDMMGWKDTLANDMNTHRQMAYAKAMGLGGVYTPQIIVDGTSDVIGSREAAVESAIVSHESDADTVPVAVHASKQEIHIAVGPAASHETQEATIWLFRVQDHATVSIGGGENEGHTVTYRNVVRDMKSVGLWKGQPVTVDLPRSDMTGIPSDTLAVVVQQGGYGRVIGAAMLDRSESADVR